MIDENDIQDWIDDFPQYFEYPRSAEEVYHLMHHVISHEQYYHYYSIDYFCNVYPLNSQFCPPTIRTLRSASRQAISASQIHNGGLFTLDSQLYWNFTNNTAEFNTYTSDVVVMHRDE
jgi:hypothetical protein